MCTCKWCGAAYTEEEQNMLDKTGDGFFCDMCDCFTHFDSKAEAARRMLLLLENGGASSEPGRLSPLDMAIPKLRKRVSPLRYPGGKSRLIDYLYSRLQQDKLDVFIEVFAGGASLGLSLLDAGEINRLILNDVDPLVFYFWKSVLEAPGYLLSRLEGPLPTLDDFWEAKAVLVSYANGNSLPQDLLAWSFFLLNRTCFSGIVKAHPMGGKAGNQDKLLSRWNPKHLSERILHIHSMADRIELHALDCCAFIEQMAFWYDRATLFVDPPYVVKGDALYNASFRKKDHERLAGLLTGLHMEFSGPDMVITYDDCPLVRDIYPYAEVEEIGRAYSIAN